MNPNKRIKLNTAELKKRVEAQESLYNMIKAVVRRTMPTAVPGESPLQNFVEEIRPLVNEPGFLKEAIKRALISWGETFQGFYELRQSFQALTARLEVRDVELAAKAAELAVKGAEIERAARERRQYEERIEELNHAIRNHRQEIFELLEAILKSASSRGADREELQQLRGRLNDKYWGRRQEDFDFLKKITGLKSELLDALEEKQKNYQTFMDTLKALERDSLLSNLRTRSAFCMHFNASMEELDKWEGWNTILYKLDIYRVGAFNSAWGEPVVDKILRIFMENFLKIRIQVRIDGQAFETCPFREGFRQGGDEIVFLLRFREKYISEETLYSLMHQMVMSYSKIMHGDEGKPGVLQGVEQYLVSLPDAYWKALEFRDVQGLTITPQMNISEKKRISLELWKRYAGFYASLKPLVLDEENCHAVAAKKQGMVKNFGEIFISEDVGELSKHVQDRKKNKGLFGVDVNGQSGDAFDRFEQLTGKSPKHQFLISRRVDRLEGFLRRVTQKLEAVVEGRGGPLGDLHQSALSPWTASTISHDPYSGEQAHIIFSDNANAKALNAIRKAGFEVHFKQRLAPSS